MSILDTEDDDDEFDFPSDFDEGDEELDTSREFVWDKELPKEIDEESLEDDE